MFRSFLEWLERLFRSPRQPYHPRPDGLLRLDLTALREELRPFEKGQAAGRTNSPQSDASFPDSRELEILRTCEDAAQRGLVATKDNCEALLLSIEQLSPSQQAAQINAVQSSAVGQIRTVVAATVPSVRRQERRCSDLGSGLVAFKAVHGLSRLASYPSSRVLHVGVLSALVLIEGAVNGVLFAQGNARGLIGGIALALLFAAFNVALGFAAGLAPFRYLTHRSWLLKAAAVLGVVSYALVALALNLAIAHYRDLVQNVQLEAASNQASVQAIRAILIEPFSLRDLESWLLFGMGAFFSVVACIDGFKFDDPYPGYGRKDRELATCQDDLESLRTERLEQLSQIRENGIRRVTVAAANASLYTQNRVLYLSRLGSFREAYDEHRGAVRDAFRILIQEYRDGNRATRSLAAPQYFSVVPDIDLPQPPIISADLESKDIAEIASHAIAQIDGAHREAIGELGQMSTEAA